MVKGLDKLLCWLKSLPKCVYCHSAYHMVFQKPDSFFLFRFQYSERAIRSILEYAYSPDCIHLFPRPCSGGKGAALVDKGICWPDSCMCSGNASNPTSSQLALVVVPNTPGSCESNEGVGRLEEDFVLLVALTGDSVPDQSLQGSRLLRPSAFFCLWVAVVYLCVLAKDTWQL